MTRVWPGLLIGCGGRRRRDHHAQCDHLPRYGGAGQAGQHHARTDRHCAGEVDSLTVPGSDDTLAARLSGLGALTGYTAGIGIGIILGLAYALGWRPSLAVVTLAATTLR